VFSKTESTQFSKILSNQIFIWKFNANHAVNQIASQIVKIKSQYRNFFIKNIIYSLKILAIFIIKLFKFIKYLFFLFIKIITHDKYQIINPAKTSKNQCNHHQILERFIKNTKIKNE
jgi:hypothetical protein